MDLNVNWIIYFNNIFFKMMLKSKPSQDSKILEYSMSNSDNKRYAELLECLDILSAKCRFPEIEKEYISKFYTTLKTLYLNWRSFLTTKIKDMFDKSFIDIEEELVEWCNTMTPRRVEKGKISIPIKLLKDLEKMYSDILEIKQILGLGIPINENAKEQLDNAFKNRILLK